MPVFRIEVDFSYHLFDIFIIPSPKDFRFTCYRHCPYAEFTICTIPLYVYGTSINTKDEHLLWMSIVNLSDRHYRLSKRKGISHVFVIFAKVYKRI